MFEVHDPEFDASPAATIAVPPGWTVEPQVQRLPPAYFAMPPMFDVRVVSPDGRAARFYPTMNFEYPRGAPEVPLWSATANGLIALEPPTSIGGWLVELIIQSPAEGVTNPELFSEARLPQTRQTLESVYGDMLSVNQQINDSVHMSGRFDLRVTAHHAAVTFDRDGVPEREDFLALILRRDYFDEADTRVSGTWSLLAMQSKGGLAADGHAALGDPTLAAVLDSWIVQEPWALAMDRHARKIRNIRHPHIPEYRDSMSERPEAVERAALERQRRTAGLQRALREGWAEIAGTSTSHLEAVR